jgi:hypothetical protein
MATPNSESEVVQHAMDCKARFDRRLLNSAAGEITFKKGQLFQVHCSNLSKTIGTERKLALMWSKPRKVVEQILNSHKLETLEGILLDGEFLARRLRRLIPQE